MTWKWIIPIAVFSFVAVSALLRLIDDVGLRKTYEADLRTTFFAAFLTMGVFLFSLRTFIVITMKEGLYESEGYISRLKDRRELSGPNASHYGTLRGLSNLLFWSTALSLLASVVQMTLGFVDCIYAVHACIGICAPAIVLLSVGVIYSEINLADLFKEWEEASVQNHQPDRHHGGDGVSTSDDDD